MEKKMSLWKIGASPSMYNISLDWSIWGWVILLQGNMDQTKEVYSIRKQHNKGRQLNKRILGMNFSIFNHKSGVLFCLQNNLGLHLSEVTFQKKCSLYQKIEKCCWDIWKKCNWTYYARQKHHITLCNKSFDMQILAKKCMSTQLTTFWQPLAEK